MNRISLQELQFQQRAFLYYYQHMVCLRDFLSAISLKEHSIDDELSKTKGRIDDLAILIQRRLAEEG